MVICKSVINCYAYEHIRHRNQVIREKLSAQKITPKRMILTEVIIQMININIGGKCKTEQFTKNGQGRQSNSDSRVC